MSMVQPEFSLLDVHTKGRICPPVEQSQARVEINSERLNPVDML